MIEENPIRKSAANYEPESEFLQQAIRIGQLLRNRAIQADVGRSFSKQSKGQASEVVRLANRKDAFSLQPNLRTILHPGFFKGIADIGYTLLRLSDRGRRLPCVRLLE